MKSSKRIAVALAASAVITGGALFALAPAAVAEQSVSLGALDCSGIPGTDVAVQSDIAVEPGDEAYLTVTYASTGKQYFQGFTNQAYQSDTHVFHTIHASKSGAMADYIKPGTSSHYCGSL